jgi:hypothetical protein
MNLCVVKAMRVGCSIKTISAFLFRACATDAMRLHACLCAVKPNVSNTFFNRWTLMFRRNVLTPSSGSKKCKASLVQWDAEKSTSIRIGEEVIEGWRKLHNEELYNLNSSNKLLLG